MNYGVTLRLLCVLKCICFQDCGVINGKLYVIALMLVLYMKNLHFVFCTEFGIERFSRSHLFLVLWKLKPVVATSCKVQKLELSDFNNLLINETQEIGY